MLQPDQWCGVLMCSPSKKSLLCRVFLGFIFKKSHCRSLSTVYDVYYKIPTNASPAKVTTLHLQDKWQW